MLVPLPQIGRVAAGWPYALLPLLEAKSKHAPPPGEHMSLYALVTDATNAAWREKPAGIIVAFS
jgi:hypothetical protein